MARRSRPRASSSRGSRAGLRAGRPRARVVGRRSGGVHRVGRTASVRMGGGMVASSIGQFAGHPSLKHERMYRALRRKGYSKEKSARISIAEANGTLNRGGWRRNRKGLRRPA